LSKREVCFDDHQKNLDIGDGIGNLLEHHLLPKGQLFDIGKRDE